MYLISNIFMFRRTIFKIFLRNQYEAANLSLENVAIGSIGTIGSWKMSLQDTHWACNCKKGSGEYLRSSEYWKPAKFKHFVNTNNRIRKKRISDWALISLFW